MCLWKVGKEAHTILFAPDHKIAVNLMKLHETHEWYNAFPPEFPVLHLRKSKITIPCSAYKDAGILHILNYMRDQEFRKWKKKLIPADHIEIAKKYIRWLGITLYVAFFCTYMQSMLAESKEVEHDILHADAIQKQWGNFSGLLCTGWKKSGTSALHFDMMHHCIQQDAISIAKRLGGSTCYSLLVAAVKSSLPFFISTWSNFLCCIYYQTSSGVLRMWSILHEDERSFVHNPK